MRLSVILCSSLLLNGGLAIATTPPKLPAWLRSKYADYLREFEAQCPLPNQLDVQTWTQEQPPMQVASFSCWNPTDQRGDRLGHWLGRLPHPQSASTFASPMTCGPGNVQCATALTQIQAQFPTQLAEAEFRCATKNGTLFFTDRNPLTPDILELRCGFFETRLFASADQPQDPLESFTSVDIPVARFSLRPTQP